MGRASPRRRIKATSKKKESKAMVLAKRDAGAQWQGQSTADWQTDFGKANRFRDAESYTMNAEGSDKKRLGRANNAIRT